MVKTYNDFKKLIKKDDQLKEAIAPLAIVRHLNRYIRKSVTEHVKGKYKNVDAKDIISELVEHIDVNSDKELSGSELAKLIQSSLIAYLKKETTVEESEARSRRLEFIKRVHERRKSLVFVGFFSGQFNQYMTRKKPLFFKGQFVLLNWFLDYIYFRARTFYSTYNNSMQKVARLGLGPVTHPFVLPAHELKNTQHLLLKPNEWKDKSCDAIVSQITSRLDVPDLLIIDNSTLCGGSYEQLKAWTKERAIALIAGTNEETAIEIISGQDDISTFINVGDIDKLYVPERLLKRLEK